MKNTTVSGTSGNQDNSSFQPWISVGDNDTIFHPIVEDGGQSTTMHIYSIVTITIHENGALHTYQLNAEQIDVFLTNEQKKKLIKKIKMAKMVEKL